MPVPYQVGATHELQYRHKENTECELKIRTIYVASPLFFLLEQQSNLNQNVKAKFSH